MASAFLCLILLFQQFDAEELRPLSGSQQGPTCGVRSLFVALRSQGADLEYEELLKPEFVGNGLGSDIGELRMAVDRFGFRAIQVSNLAYTDLLRIENPVLLHMRSSPEKKEYNHWIVYMGSDEDGRLNVFDPAGGQKGLSLAELLSSWSGTGLIIGNKGLSLDMPVWGVAVNTFAWIFLVAVPLSCINSFIGKKVGTVWSLKGFLLQSFWLFLTVISISFVFHSMAPVGFLRNGNVLANISMRYKMERIEEIAKGDVVKLIREGALLVDARLSGDFGSGTISAAINIPTNSPINYQREILDSVDKSKTFIVFCKSSGCSFSDEIASFLKRNGCSRVFIYRGGIEDWSKGSL